MDNDPFKPTSTIDGMLESLGIGSRAFEKIRLGSGVVGKVSYAVVAVILVFAVIARQTTETGLLIGLAAGAASVFFVYLFSVLRFTAKHKEFALLDGAELIAWRHLEITAKSVPNPPQQSIVSAPDRPLLTARDDKTDE